MGHSIQDDHVVAPATTSSPSASPPAARARGPRFPRPAWYPIFYALAGFALLTVLLGLYLSHRITTIYFERLIGVFVLLTIAGATAYGRRLSRRAETERQATEARFENILNIAADAI